MLTAQSGWSERAAPATLKTSLRSRRGSLAPPATLGVGKLAHDREAQIEPGGTDMDFEIPADIREKLAELDAFIEREIAPLEREHPQYFDHRREFARTDWENGGRPRREWEDLLAEMRRRADAAGHVDQLPPSSGGDGSAGRGPDVGRTCWRWCAVPAGR